MAVAKKTAKVDEPVIENTADEKYKSEIEELKNQIALLMKSATSTQQVQENPNDPDRDVLVVSLTRGVLNLSTEGHGNGEVYRFNKFGEEQIVPYGNLKDIIKNNKSFTINGNYYICDEYTVEKQRLSKSYEKIVSKEQLEELFAEPKDKFLRVFDKMMPVQQLIFSEMLTDKLVNGDDVDANITNVVAEKTNKNIYEIVKTIKKTKEIAKE